MGNSTFLYGASGHCKVIVDILHLNGVVITGVIDDNPKAPHILDIPVVGREALSTADNIIISIGDNASRKKVSMINAGTFINAIHPAAVVSSLTEIGAGTVVMAGAVINPGTKVGRHCIINTLSVIEHDCSIGDFAHISPNAALAGNVTVLEGSHVGIGASIVQGITIGKWATVGAGAVILKDVPDYAVVVGNPGKILRIDQPQD